MSLRQLKFKQPTIVALARAIKIRFPDIQLNVLREDKKLIIKTKKTDYFTVKEIELITKSYFPTQQVQVLLSRRLN